MRSTEDFHTKARVRNAAIACFGRDGFTVGIRTIAAAAGVSPGLVVHHFGSKVGLRQACDEHVLEMIRDAKLQAVGSHGPEAMLAQFARVEEHRPIAAYAVASLAAGGDLAEQLLDDMTTLTEEFLAAGVAAGTIAPSRDPGARARYLTLTSLGMLLLEYRRHETDPDAVTAAFDAVAATSIGPGLELFTHGLFTDSRYLDALEEPAPPANERDDS